LFDAHFGPYLDGSAFKGTRRGEKPVPFLLLPFNLHWPANYRKWGKKGYATETKRIAREFVRHFEEKGWDKTYLEIMYNHKKSYRMFPFDGDETMYLSDEFFMDIMPEMFGDVFEGTGTKFLFRMDSSMCYNRHWKMHYADLYKMWIVAPLYVSWDPESVKHMKDKGNIVMIYGGLNPISECMMSMFMQVARCMLNGIDGFTYWGAFDFNGDTLKNSSLSGDTLFYPGEKFGCDSPLPSLRLKALRNIIQIADLYMLSKGGTQENGLSDMIHRLLGIDRGFWVNKKPWFYDEAPETTGGYYDDYLKEPGINPPRHAWFGKSPALVGEIKKALLGIGPKEDNEAAFTVAARGENT
jgi:hypothetical protein